MQIGRLLILWGSRKYPYHSLRCFLTLKLLPPPPPPPAQKFRFSFILPFINFGCWETPSEFPATIDGKGMDIFWNHTLLLTEWEREGEGEGRGGQGEFTSHILSCTFFLLHANYTPVSHPVIRWPSLHHFLLATQKIQFLQLYLYQPLVFLHKSTYTSFNSRFPPHCQHPHPLQWLFSGQNSKIWTTTPKNLYILLMIRKDQALDKTLNSHVIPYHPLSTFISTCNYNVQCTCKRECTSFIHKLLYLPSGPSLFLPFPHEVLPMEWV